MGLHQRGGVGKWVLKYVGLFMLIGLVFNVESKAIGSVGKIL
jgi:hypothetical protein